MIPTILFLWIFAFAVGLAIWHAAITSDDNDFD